MDPQLDQRLRAIEEKLENTNVIVSKLRHEQVTARNRKYLYWGVIITLGIVSYYSIKPYVAQLKEAYGLGDTSTTTNTNYADLLKTLTE